MLAENNDHYTIGNKGDDVDNKLQEPTFLMDDVPLTGASSFFCGAVKLWRMAGACGTIKVVFLQKGERDYET